jgi:1-acyl-sn-glycerol-3-phosphate acyltransferase
MADALYQAVKRLLSPVADAYFGLRASADCDLPDGPFVLAANHSSLLDWVFVARFVARPIRFVLSRAFFDQAGITWAYRRLGVIPMRDDGIELSAMRDILRTLASGGIIGFFPEGRITLDGTLLPGQPGVIAIAARASVPIVPAGVRGAFEAFPRDALIPRPRPVRVRFGAPLVVPPSAAHDRAERQSQAAALMRRIGDLRRRA